VENIANIKNHHTIPIILLLISTLSLNPTATAWADLTASGTETANQYPQMLIGNCDVKIY